MISALVDVVLLLALIATTWKMISMHRELKRLGSYHMDYQRIFDQTALALDGIEVSIQELNVRGNQILNALGTRMDDARDLIAEIDGLTREAKRQQSVLRAELKELSKATALLGTPKHTDAPQRDSSVLYEAGDGAVHNTQSLKNRANALLAEDRPATTADAAHVRETRIYRIDNALSSPFRSVSMNQKDDL